MQKRAVRGSIRGWCGWGFAGVFALGMVGLAAPVQANETGEDSALSALLPGEAMVDEELEEVHGKGIAVSASGNSSVGSALGPIDINVTIQRIIDDALRRSTPRLPTVRVRSPRPDSSLMSEVAASSSSNN